MSTAGRLARIRDAIRAAHAAEELKGLGVKRDPGIRVEAEDHEKAKRLQYREQGIQLVGRI